MKAIHSQMTTLASESCSAPEAALKRDRRSRCSRGCTDRFPMINSLIQRINIKKRKDTIILASVIGICLFILIIYNF